jgi:hypothetical protein
MPFRKKERPVPSGVSINDPNRILTRDQFEFLTSLNWSTLKRNRPDLIIRLSRNRLGVRYRDALSICDRR